VLARQSGNRGFGHTASHVLVISADLRAFVFAHERNQCWVDGGLFSMSLVYAFHALGLGTCCLNWSVAREDDRRLRRAAGLADHENVVMMLAIAAAFVGLTILTTMIVGPGRYNRAKYDSYECGIEPTPQPIGGGRFPVKYYITAMLFIVFDIEIVFLYPWAVSFEQMGTFALVEMVLFIVTVFVAYIYVLRRGGLEWD
jgi:NADH-quinone oxidoreductase subunit A